MADSIIETTDDNFDAEVKKADVPVLVDFWAPWCGPCRALTPTIEAFADATSGKVKVVKHNTQDHEKTPADLQVTAIPTLMVFKGGEMVHRIVGGGKTVSDLMKMVSEHTGVELGSA